MKPNYKAHMGYTLQRYIIWEMQTRESARIIAAWLLLRFCAAAECTDK